MFYRRQSIVEAETELNSRRKKKAKPCGKRK